VEYFTAIWYNLQPFCIVCGHLVHFFRFGTFGPRKIWQPRWLPSRYQETVLSMTLAMAAWLRNDPGFLKRLPGLGWERTRDLLISFIFSFHHLTAEPQRLPMTPDSYRCWGRPCRQRGPRGAVLPSEWDPSTAERTQTPLWKKLWVDENLKIGLPIFKIQRSQKLLAYIGGICLARH
jgi:hypothetical protein